MTSEPSPGPWKDEDGFVCDVNGKVVVFSNLREQIVREHNAFPKLVELAKTVLESIPVVAAIGLPMYYDQQKMLQLAREALELARETKMAKSSVIREMVDVTTKQRCYIVDADAHDKLVELVAEAASEVRKLSCEALELAKGNEDAE